MIGTLEKMVRLLSAPSNFFEDVRSEGWRPSFCFFLTVTAILSVVTPIVNYVGVESTDLSSAYQAQILAYRIVKNYLLTAYGPYAYLAQPLLILGWACVLLFFLTVFLHLVFRLIGGKGSILNAWKAACYGVAPSLLGGFLPYISLFAAFYAALLQVYLGPKILYKTKESRAIFFLALVIALIFIEMSVTGTTVGLFQVIMCSLTA